MKFKSSFVPASLFLLLSCGRAPEAPSYRKTFERGPISVTLKARPSKLRVGDPVTLEFQVKSGPDWRLLPPDFSGLPSPWKVLESGPAQGGARTVLEYDLLGLDPKKLSWEGPVTLSGLSLRFEKPGAETLGFPLEDLIFERSHLVEGKADPSQLRPLKNPVPLPGIPPWVWVLAGLAALAGAGLWWRKRKREAPAPTGPPPPTPFEAAWAALERLLAEDLVTQGRAEEHVDRLTSIIRLYIEGRFHLRAPERTTEEFLEEVSRSGALVKEHKKLLADFLVQADLVKFAKARPGPKQLDDFLASARKFLDETKPSPLVEDPEQRRRVGEGRVRGQSS